MIIRNSCVFSISSRIIFEILALDSSNNRVWFFYQTEHFFNGFILLSDEQLKALEKSTQFENDPIILKSKKGHGKRRISKATERSVTFFFLEDSQVNSFKCLSTQSTKS